MKRANPEGSPNLVREIGYYRPSPTSESDWRRLERRRVIWYPALSLCRGRIIDVGCGPGIVGQMALDLGYDYYCGLDFSPHVIDLARERCPAFFLQADLAASVIPPMVMRWADTVLMTEVLEHVEEDLAIVAAVPKGKAVVLSVPSFWSEGHCRWFKSREQAAHRYRAHLHIDVALTEKSPTRQRWYFILKGRRK